MNEMDDYSSFDPNFIRPRFAEEISFKQATLEQMVELEKAWMEAPVELRLERVAQRAMELGLEITHMHRDRSSGICPHCDRPIIDHDAQERKECHDAVSGFRRYLDTHQGIPPGFPDPWED